MRVKIPNFFAPQIAQIASEVVLRQYPPRKDPTNSVEKESNPIESTNKVVWQSSIPLHHFAKA